MEKTFAGSCYNYGYYAFLKNDLLHIGEERGREGGILYQGEYKGEDTPYLYKVKSKNPKLYNSIVKHFEKESKQLVKASIEYIYTIEVDCFEELDDYRWSLLGREKADATASWEVCATGWEKTPPAAFEAAMEQKNIFEQKDKR